jgi:hypothetical protein
MTPDDFRVLLGNAPDAVLLDTTLHSDVAPYVFNVDPPKWDAFRMELAESLDIDVADIRIVGSGRLGFSLAPEKNLRAFRDTSDIDVVVVNADAFDALWGKILRAAYPRPPVNMGPPLAAIRNGVYTGYLTPVEIKLDVRIYGQKARPALETRTKWFNTLKEAARFPPRRHEDIHGRLYRTWDHAELYHLHGLSLLRASLQP